MGQLLTLIDGIISKKPFREHEFSPINMKISWDIILLTIKLFRTTNHFTQKHTNKQTYHAQTHIQPSTHRAHKKTHRLIHTPKMLV